MAKKSLDGRRRDKTGRIDKKHGSTLVVAIGSELFCQRPVRLMAAGGYRHRALVAFGVWG